MAEDRAGKIERPSVRCHPRKPKPKRSTLQGLVKGHFPQEARELTIRQTTQGPLRAKVLILDVWLWDSKGAAAKRRTVVARECDDGKTKISWTNAPAGASAEELAYMQAQRHWIERSSEDAKSELGLAEYRVRKWRAWHHHMALVSLMLFVLKERVCYAESAPLLSARGVLEFLRFHLYPGDAAQRGRCSTYTCADTSRDGRPPSVTRTGDGRGGNAIWSQSRTRTAARRWLCRLEK